MSLLSARFHEFDQLVERLTPAFLEAHRRMPLTVLSCAVHDAGFIERSAVLRRQRDDGGAEKETLCCALAGNLTCCF